ncbi:MAG TPA: 30S ribosomal protein S12 methylthiotransferase RimO [Acidobacteriota bacterium]|nr:30S ribosomal protein S12 methylthiotransferase RimO [Acidobacteriota bacterium]
MAKIILISLGCPKNTVDSEVMTGLLQERGHTLTTDPSEAEIIIINSCSFIEDAKKESIDTILAAARYRETGACRRLIVTGCLPERYYREMSMELSEVDVMLGTNQIEQIIQAVEGTAVPAPDSYGRRNAELYLYDHTTPRTLIGPRHTAYIKIAEGCDRSCSFCIIPKIRGRYRSRAIPSLLEEASRLASNGVKEITLVSQDTTWYGRDLGMKDGLADLLEALAGIDELHWIRFLYAYPDAISDRLLRAINASEKICRYIDLPLQHVSAGILSAMRRGGDRAMLTRTIERIRNAVPGITLRTTLIVGFPGETKKDFVELKNFCREIEFDRLGVFIYSDEEDTPAYAISPKTARRTARNRQRILMEQQEEINGRKNRLLKGKEFEILVEGPSRESDMLLEGRTEFQAPEIDGVCLINDADVGALQSGEFRTIRITRALGHDLLGTIVK